MCCAFCLPLFGPSQQSGKVMWPFCSVASTSKETIEQQEKETPRVRTFESLVEEEIPIQRASVSIEGGMPGCLTLFDRFFLCYSLVSQAKAVYRFGEPRNCSRKLDDFKFCMTLKSQSQEDKDEAWVQRRAEWWARRRLEPSSEDVWEARTDAYIDTRETVQ